MISDEELEQDASKGKCCHSNNGSEGMAMNDTLGKEKKKLW